MIPKEVRRTFCIREGDPLELFTSGQYIAFRKYTPARSVQASLDVLKEAVLEEGNLQCANSVLEKISEIGTLLAQEDMGGNNG